MKGAAKKTISTYAGAERGLRRPEAAIGVIGPEALARILESLKLDSMEKVDNLETLKQTVLKLEQVAAEATRRVSAIGFSNQHAADLSGLTDTGKPADEI